MQARHANYARFRPSNAALATPGARWAFAKRCVLFEVRDRRGTLRRRWPELHAFAALRREYCALWRRYVERLGVSKPAKSAARAARLAALEHQLLPRDVRLFRSLVGDVDAAAINSASPTKNVVATTTTTTPTTTTPTTTTTTDKKKSSKRLKRFAGVMARKLQRNKNKDQKNINDNNDDNSDEEVVDEHQSIAVAQVDGDDITTSDLEQLLSAASTTDATSAPRQTNLRITFQLEHIAAKCVTRSGTTPLLELLSDEMTLCVDVSSKQFGIAAKVRTFHVLDHFKGIVSIERLCACVFTKFTPIM
jgi:hypothetical protein